MRPRQVGHGSYLGPPSYSDVMREASDNDEIHGPTQPAAEHTSAESELPESIRMQISYEGRVSGVVEIDYDREMNDDELGERAYTAVYELFPLGINVDDVEATYERPS